MGSGRSREISAVVLPPGLDLVQLGLVLSPKLVQVIVGIDRQVQNSDGAGAITVSGTNLPARQKKGCVRSLGRTAGTVQERKPTEEARMSEFIGGLGSD